MDEQTAIKMLAEWDSIISPVDADGLLFWLSHWVDEVEDQLTKADGVVAQRRLTLIEAGNSVAKANVYLACESDYTTLLALEKQLRSLKSARANVKRRYEIICNKLLQGTRRY